MTLFIATVTERAAYLTQDTFCSTPTASSPRHAPMTRDAAAAIAETYANGGAAPQMPIAFAPKIFALPHLNMMMGGAGEFRLIWAFANLLLSDPMISDIVDLERYAQMRWPSLAKDSDLKFGTIVIAAGYSHIEERAIGIAFSSDDDFKPVRLSEGHSIMPAPDVTAPDYGELADAWEAAAYGVGTETFHQALAWNQYRAYAAGKFPEGAGIGGQLITAKITPGEVSIRVVDQFPGFQEQRARLAASHGSGQ